MGAKRAGEGEVPVPRKQKRLRTAEAPTTVEESDDDLASNIESEYSPDGSPLSGRALSAQTPFTPDSRATSHKYPSELKTFQCPYHECSKAFNRPSRLTDHLRSHTNDRIYKCPHNSCDKDFLRDSHLNHHIKSAHTDIRDYACHWGDCGKTFLTATRLRRHIAVHEGREKYRCSGYPPCDEIFRKHATLQRHVKSVHLGQKPFPCTHADPATGGQCTEAFDTAGKLRAHKGRFHGGTRFTCAECPQPSHEDEEPASYQTYAELQSHVRVVHPPTCSHCSKVYSSARELRHHIEISHNETKLSERRIHLCSYPDCSKGFTKKGNLVVHVRTVHGGEKRFACGETDLSTSKKVEGWTGEGACGNRFSAKLSLEEHVRTAHMGLVNSRLEGKPRKGRRKTRRKERAGPLLASLTGEGYARDTGRSIGCIMEGCAYMFFREYDLGVHLKSVHGFSALEVEEILADAEAGFSNQGGILWADYDVEMDVDEGDAIAQDELDRQYQEMMQLDSVAGADEHGQGDSRLEEGIEGLVDPFLT